MTKLDPWVWRAVYADGSTLDEYDDDAPDGRGWAQAEAYGVARGTRIAQVLLIPQRDGLSTHVVTLTGATTQVRIFRRRMLTVSAETGETVGIAEPITAVELAGAYTFLFADGSIVVSDDLNAV